MTRNRKSAKDAGARFEALIAAYLAEHLDDRIERRKSNGNRDRGDISGLRHMGERVVVEAKDYGGRLHPGVWVGEAEVERGNDDAVAALVVAKRIGKGQAGDQYVLLTLRDLVSLLRGERVTS